MQEFKSRFTTDISQHQQAMAEFKARTASAVHSVRGQLLALGATGISIAGVKSTLVNMMRLGAEMQNTRIAFEVMMGSVEKGNAVLEQLNKFSDVTPFDNAEVIASGRVLLNCGTAVDALERKLTVLGNIAAGTQSKLAEVVNIYAKAANKGKVQAEELAQLSERGVPILNALSKTLGMSTAEIMKLGEQGKLSFAILSEAMDSMGGAGGRYFGLMEKQSQSLKGKWDGLCISLRNAAMEIGERSIPGLASAVDDLQAKFQELADSGELDAMMRSTSEAIVYGATALKDFAKFVVDNRETIKDWGFNLGVLVLIAKVSSAATGAGAALAAMARVTGSAVTAETLRATAAVQASEKSQVAASEDAGQRKALVAAATAKTEEARAAHRAAAVARSYAREAQAAWDAARAKLAAAQASGTPTQRLIEDVKKTEAAYEGARQAAMTAGKGSSRAISEARAAWAGVPAAVAPATASVVRFSGMVKLCRGALAGLKMVLSNIGAVSMVAFAGYEIGRYIGKLLELDKVVQNLHLRQMGKSSVEIAEAQNAGERPGKKYAKIDYVKSRNELKRLKQEQEAAANVASSGGDQRAVDAARKKFDELHKAHLAKIKELEDFEKEGAEKKKRLPLLARKLNLSRLQEQFWLPKLEGDVPRFDEKTGKFAERGEKMMTAGNGMSIPVKFEYTSDQKSYMAAVMKRRAVQKEFEDARAHVNKLAEQKRLLDKSNSDESYETAKKELSAAQKLRAEMAAQTKEKRRELEERIAAGQKELAQKKRDLENAEDRDRMTERIEKWREEIDKYKEEIAKTKKMLSELGLSADEDILRTPEAIRQKRADDILQAKIEAYNKGEKVTFSTGEKKRINELRNQQLEARRKQGLIGVNESQIEIGQKHIKSTELTEKEFERNDQRAMLSAKERTLMEAGTQLRAFSEANKPTLAALGKIEEILKKRLPNK